MSDSKPMRAQPLIVGLPKLALLTLLTGGLYELYWFYKNWQAALPKNTSTWKIGYYAVFGGFTGFGLFRRLKITYWSSAATAYLILPAAFSLLPGSYRYLSYLVSLVPIYYVQATINRDYPQVTASNHLSRTDIILLVIGVPLVLVSLLIQQSA